MTFSEELATVDYNSNNAIEDYIPSISYYLDTVADFSEEEYCDKLIDMAMTEYERIRYERSGPENTKSNLLRSVEKWNDKRRLYKELKGQAKNKGANPEALRKQADKLVNATYNKQRYGRTNPNAVDKTLYHGKRGAEKLAVGALNAKDWVANKTLGIRAAMGSKSAQNQLRWNAMTAPFKAAAGYLNKNGGLTKIVDNVGKAITDKSTGKSNLVKRWNSKTQKWEYYEPDEAKKKFGYAASEEQQIEQESVNYSEIPSPKETAEYQQKQIADQVSKQVINAASFSEQHEKNLKYTEVINSAWDSLLSYGNS